MLWDARGANKGYQILRGTTRGTTEKEKGSFSLVPIPVNPTMGTDVMATAVPL